MGKNVEGNGNAKIRGGGGSLMDGLTAVNVEKGNPQLICIGVVGEWSLKTDSV